MNLMTAKTIELCTYLIKKREPLRDFPNTYLEVTSVRDFKNFKWIDLGNLAQMKRQQVTKLNEM